LLLRSIIYRRGELCAGKALQRAGAEPEIHSVWNAALDRKGGKRTVRQPRPRNIKDGIIPLVGGGDFFLHFGVEAEIGYLPRILPSDEKGCIIPPMK